MDKTMVFGVHLAGLHRRQTREISKKNKMNETSLG